MVGVLVAVGSGENPAAVVKEVLESRDRRHGGITIQPNGLYLVEVTISRRIRSSDRFPRTFFSSLTEISVKLTVTGKSDLAPSRVVDS